jgi:hypothetical protein
MNRIDIINALIEKHNYKTYLEIGVRDGSCFNAIKCENKTGVDPDPASAATHYITSDDFFESMPYFQRPYTIKDNNGERTFNIPQKFDIIFIDGLHHSDQVVKDILNSLNFLSEGGTIVMHDCLPTSEFMQQIPMQPSHNEWTGDVWKAFVRLRSTRNDLEMFVVDIDWGCGVITRGQQETLMIAATTPDHTLSYTDFVQHKEVWMNRRTVDWFKNYYLKP